MYHFSGQITLSLNASLVVHPSEAYTGVCKIGLLLLPLDVMLGNNRLTPAPAFHQVSRTVYLFPFIFVGGVSQCSPFQAVIGKIYRL